ncbi:MAG: DUF116 domain-containing protein [Nitrospiraceae bacterium]|nr:MAG: DUF116 domain-containing protein [Nitrospiraceae bacterium]
MVFSDMLKKMRFLGGLYIYKLQGALGMKRADIMPVINEYYRDDFRKLDKRDIAVILPHCLISSKCPARFSKADGILCSKCTLCGCGEIYKIASQKGYQFYITPSVGFTKRLVGRKKLRGVIGVACDYEIDKGIASEKITNNGVVIESRRIKTQGIRLDVYDCIQNNVDWGKIKELL